MEGHKLFQVSIRFLDSGLSMLMTHGGTTGGVHEGNVFVSAKSREEAISTAWDQQIYVGEAQHVRNGELLTKKREGTLEKHEEYLFASPRTPTQRDKWRAVEVVVPGYQILCVPVPLGEKSECIKCNGTGLLRKGHGYCTCPKGKRLVEEAMVAGEHGL